MLHANGMRTNSPAKVNGSSGAIRPRVLTSATRLRISTRGAPCGFGIAPSRSGDHARERIHDRQPIRFASWRLPTMRLARSWLALFGSRRGVCSADSESSRPAPVTTPGNESTIVSQSASPIRFASPRPPTKPLLRTSVSLPSRSFRSRTVNSVARPFHGRRPNQSVRPGPSTGQLRRPSTRRPCIPSRPRPAKPVPGRSASLQSNCRFRPRPANGPGDA